MKNMNLWRRVHDFLEGWECEAWDAINTINTLRKMHPAFEEQLCQANITVSRLQQAIFTAMLEHDDLRLNTKVNRRIDGDPVIALEAN